MSFELIVFAREPIPGRTKTRLCPPLDGETAAALYESFLRDVLATARAIPDVKITIAYTPESDPAYFARFAPDLCSFPQHGATLGERMANAFEQCLQGERSALLIGSDFPTLPASHLIAGFDLLTQGTDAVFGPSDDGGYYLVGMARLQRRLLCDIPMSTPTVLTDSLALAKQLELRVELAPAHYDIDDGTDLARLWAELQVAPPDVAVHTRRFLASIAHI
jgi:uncharacterized protein